MALSKLLSRPALGLLALLLSLLTWANAADIPSLRYMIKSENNAAPSNEIRKMTFASADPSIRGHSGVRHWHFHIARSYD